MHVRLRLAMRSVECSQVEVRGRGHVSLTWRLRVGGRGCKYCRHRSPGECRPERKGHTQREGDWHEEILKDIIDIIMNPKKEINVTHQRHTRRQVLYTYRYIQYMHTE